ncbi:MAG: transcriptional regulator, winged helix family [Pseudonocardiales bacterium]|nr:transcriptional regulator, winged helix family [Pseudonocardiales bacterium]
MEIHDLGPLRVDTDGINVALNGRRLESVLAILCANAQEVVSVDALIDAVWGSSAPARAAQSLESLVWRLRKVLEPGRAAREAATVLQTEDLGYRLALPRGNVDSHRLAQAARETTELIAANRFGDALELADGVLPRWRGQPYLGVPDAGWMPPVRAQVAEAHLELQQNRVEALLATGQPERALSELAGPLADHPYRERLWGQRMIALYRSGRQSEALAAFAGARQVLTDDLGLDPGPALRDLHERILNQERSLDLVRPNTTSEVHLPSRRAALIGRAADLTLVQAALQERPLVTLTGPGGTGKTRLAIEAAYLARANYPDGVWFVDLADVTDATALWSRVAGALGLALQPDAKVDDLTVAFLTPRTILLVLDNCEQVLDGVAAVADRIIDSAPLVTLLATSRESLELAGEQVQPIAPLEPPTRTDALAENASVQLFERLLGETAPHLDLDGPDGAAIVRICTAVGGLPLGLELAAARARNFELAEVAAALERNPTTLTRPGRGSPRQLTLHDTIEWSHRLARADERVLHRRLATISGQFTAQVAEGLCAVDPLRPDQAMDLVAGLVHRSLLTPARTPRSGGPPLFAQLVPIRAHARAALSASGEAGVVESARDQWVLDRLVGAPCDGRAGQAAWYDWVEDNYPAIDSALASTLVETPSAAGLPLIEALTVYWYDRSRFVDGMPWLAVAVDLPGLTDFDRARAQACYGSARALNQETDQAQPLLGTAIAGLSSPADDQAAIAGELLVRAAASAWAGDLWTDAATAATEAHTIGARTGNPHLLLRARAVGTACELITGDPVRAVADATAVLEDNRAVGNHFAAFFACITNGVAALMQRDADAGLHWTGQAMVHQRALGVRNVGDTLEQRGNHYAIAGHFDAAVRCFGAASAQHEREGRRWPRHPGTAETVEGLRSALTTAAYERNWNSGQRLGRVEQATMPEEWG